MSEIIKIIDERETQKQQQQQQQKQNKRTNKDIKEQGAQRL